MKRFDNVKQKLTKALFMVVLLPFYSKVKRRDVYGEQQIGNKRQ